MPYLTALHITRRAMLPLILTIVISVITSVITSTLTIFILNRLKNKKSKQEYKEDVIVSPQKANKSIVYSNNKQNKSFKQNRVENSKAPDIPEKQTQEKKLNPKEQRREENIQERYKGRKEEIQKKEEIGKRCEKKLNPRTTIPENVSFIELAVSDGKLVQCNPGQTPYYHCWKYEGKLYYKFNYEDAKAAKAINNRSVIIDPFCQKDNKSIPVDNATAFITLEYGEMDSSYNIIHKSLIKFQ